MTSDPQQKSSKPDLSYLSNTPDGRPLLPYHLNPIENLFLFVSTGILQVGCCVSLPIQWVVHAGSKTTSFPDPCWWCLHLLFFLSNREGSDQETLLFKGYIYIYTYIYYVRLARNKSRACTIKRYSIQKR
jgi:hypothetical protein